MADEHALGDLGDAAAEFAGAAWGPSERRQRMVPFHWPSTTESVASMGHGELSFLETGIDASLPVLTTLSVRLCESAQILPASDHAKGKKDDGSGCGVYDGLVY